MCASYDSFVFKNLRRYSTGKNKRCGYSSGEVTASGVVLEAAVFDLGSVIRVAGAQQIRRFCIISAAGVGVGNGQRNGGARGMAIHHARKSLNMIMTIIAKRFRVR